MDNFLPVGCPQAHEAGADTYSWAGLRRHAVSLHGFTRALCHDLPVSRPKFDPLAFTLEAVELADRTDHTLGYIAKVFAQTALPYREPGDVRAWGRRNGDVSIRIEPGLREIESGGWESIGLPYGVLPRLTLTWLATEVVRTKERRVVLGHSLADFLREIDRAPAGGPNGTIRRLETQLNRLFASRITIDYRGHPNRQAGAQTNVADVWDLFWSKKNPEQPTLMPSFVYLSEHFYNQIISRPVPVSMDALRLLKGSPLRLDIYCWLTHRMYALDAPTEVSWNALAMQFGPTDKQLAPNQLRSFKSHFLKQLAQVLCVYKANVDDTPYGLMLRPSSTHIPAKPRQHILPVR